jgi:hypothetical protein
VQENIGVTRLIKRAPAGQGMTAYRRKIIFQPEGVVFHGIFQVLLEHCNGFFPVPIALERVCPTWWDDQHRPPHPAFANPSCACAEFFLAWNLQDAAGHSSVPIGTQKNQGP